MSVVIINLRNTNSGRFFDISVVFVVVYVHIAFLVVVVVVVNVAFLGTLLQMILWWLLILPLL